MTMECTCGTAASHEIARRTTFDGTAIVLWSDGAVTGRMGFKLPGVPVARPRTPDARRVSLAAAWLLAGEVELYELAELPALYDACRWAAARNGTAGDVRARLVAVAGPSVRPVWTVVSTDRDGKPTERVWTLPRLRWPGLAVFDFCGRAERYELFNIDRSDTCTTTGIRFATLAALAAHLDTISLSLTGT